MPTPAKMTGAQMKQVRDQRNLAKLAQARRTAEDGNHGEQGVNMEPPPGVKVPDSSGIDQSMQGTPLENPPGMKGPAASAYAARREQGRQAAGLPPTASPPAGAPPAQVPALPKSGPAAPPTTQHKAEPPIAPPNPEKKDHEGGGGPMPNPVALPPAAAGELPPEPGQEPPHSADPMPGTPPPIPHHEGDEHTGDPGGEPHPEVTDGLGEQHPGGTGDGSPPPAATEAVRDEAWTDMMSESEMEPQAGKPYKLSFLPKRAGTPGMFWQVEVNDQPVGTIPLAAQTSWSVIQKQFEDQANFPRAFRSRMAQDGFLKTFAAVRGQLYRARIAKTELAKQVEATIRAKLEEDFALRRAKMREEYVGMLHLADEAMRKNILHDGSVHPLKDALVRAFSAEHQISAHKVLATVERAMETCGDQALRQADAKASEWLQAPAEFQAAVKKEVRASAAKPVTRMAAASNPYDRIAQLVAGSLPVVVGQTPPDGDDARQAEADARVIRASIGSL